jgi:DNA-binding CsgD family transcriptional regulator
MISMAEQAGRTGTGMERLLIGREAETAAITALLDATRDHRGGAMVLRGEPGIGKSSLVEYAAAQASARGMGVLSTAGVQAEVHVPYAGLHRLLRTSAAGATVAGLDRADLATAARALTEPDNQSYRVALDLLTLLGAARAPLLLTVEDAHWLDRETWEVLAFVGRRVDADRVLLLMSMRDGAEADRRTGGAALPQLRVEPLAREAARALLDTVAPDLITALRDRVLAEAAGNPLGIIELGSVAVRSGAAALLPSWLPLGDRVERTFAAMVDELAPVTRDLLLIAALDDGDDLDEVLAAGAVLAGRPVTGDDLEPAVSARLVRVDGAFRVKFRHPLLRSALHQTAGPGGRRRAHGALAEALVGQAERGIWHRAAAATGPDEALARELTETARRGAYRQAASVALAALERAAQLSEDEHQRNSRLLSAADMAAEQGDSETVRRLLRDVESRHLRPAEAARWAWYAETFLGTGWSGTDRLATFAEIIDTMRREGEADLALESLLSIGLRVYWANPTPELRRLFLDVGDRLGVPQTDPRLVAAIGMIDPVERGAVVLDRLAELANRVDLSSYNGQWLGTAANAVGAYPLASVFYARSAAGLRAQGRLGSLAQLLNNEAHNAANRGETRLAVAAANEARALALETGHVQWALTADLARALAEALRGNGAAAREIADAVEGALLAARQHPVLAIVQLVRGVEALASGRPDDAYAQLWRIFDPADAAHHAYYRVFAVGFLAEAAARAGRHADVAPVVDEMAAIVAIGRSPALSIAVAYARAVLASDDAEAAAAYEAALAADLSQWPFERARLQLAYGAWLRRQRRAADARPPLRAAAATFDALGVAPWAERARGELRASGETVRRPTDALGTLTPQEMQVAQLAAAGLSNKEIAERLFLSARTVTTHLYRIFPKVGVTSRAELRNVLPT